MTAGPLRIALVQMNAVVGDIAGNESEISAGIALAHDAGAQLVVFPELALTGYPPEDLLLKEHFLADARAALERIAADTTEIVAVVGYPERAEDVHNSAAILADGKVQASYRKQHLPNYGVFDELRYFQPGERGATIAIDGVTVGLTICEDIWQPGPPLSDEALSGARVIVNLSASPYAAGKGARREQMIQQRARDELVAVAFCGLVGGQDELVFDGCSLVVDHEGTVIARAPQFERGAADRRRRSGHRRLRAPARHAPPRAGRAGPRQRRPARVVHASAATRDDDAPHPRRSRRSRRSWRSSRRSTARSCSARATTPARTASSTSCWA